MVEVLSLKQDENFALKKDVLEQLSREGFLDQIKAQLRSQVIKAMEQQKKKSYGRASKYMQ